MVLGRQHDSRPHKECGTILTVVDDSKAIKSALPFLRTKRILIYDIIDESFRRWITRREQVSRLAWNTIETRSSMQEEICTAMTVLRPIEEQDSRIETWIDMDAGPPAVRFESQSAMHVQSTICAIDR